MHESMDDAADSEGTTEEEEEEDFFDLQPDTIDVEDSDESVKDTTSTGAARSLFTESEHADENIEDAAVPLEVAGL